MKQIQILYQNIEDFRSRIREIRNANAGKTGMMQFYYEKSRENELDGIIAVMEEEYPECRYFGASSNANIADGTFSENTILAVCTVFDDPGTRIKILQYEFTDDTEEQVCDDLLHEVSRCPWVKGIEMLLTIRDMSLTNFCDRLSNLDVRIRVFGGCALNPEIDTANVSVFSDEEGIMSHGVVFVLLGGPELFIETAYVHGWRPLGRQVYVTRAEGNRLYELGGNPAYETYYRYLQIENDENFYANTLEFPIASVRNGVNILRVPSKCLPDGSIIMSSDMITGSKAQLSYGDPQSIMKNILDEASKLADFVPEGILLFNCASRRAFWGSEDADKELRPFQTLASTGGFYTGGEFHRMEKSLNQHNVTLVIVGMREGQPGPSKKEQLSVYDRYFHRQVSMVRRLATFIDASTRELDESNRKLETMNALLKRKATTDELTDVFNRREIQSRIIRETESGGTFSLIMLDLDFFKNVNDTYGHEEGDRVLSKFAKIMKLAAEQAGFLPAIGRWGGEEFMILLTASDAGDAYDLAEKIRISFSETVFPVSGAHTVSCGVTVFRHGETADAVCSRVDKALYSSKNKGRNRTTII